jgi:hypothetical protein
MVPAPALPESGALAARTASTQRAITPDRDGAIASVRSIEILDKVSFFLIYLYRERIESRRAIVNCREEEFGNRAARAGLKSGDPK